MEIIFKTCPTCGKKSIRRVEDDCTLGDGTTVKHLRRWQCASCKSNFFDDDAMDQIARVRAQAGAKRRPAMAD